MSGILYFSVGNIMLLNLVKMTDGACNSEESYLIMSLNDIKVSEEGIRVL